MSEEEISAPPPAEAAADETSAVSESAAAEVGTEVGDAVAANGDVEMKDASCAVAENGTEGKPEQEAPRTRTRSSSFDVRESGDGASDDEAEAATAAKKPVLEATRVSARTASKAADREGGGGAGDNDNALSSLLDAAEIRTATANPAGGTGMSFLDTLTEEERRTRLRHVPAADGFRGLQRSEVRRDLALARSILTGASGKAGTIASSKSGGAGGGSSGSASSKGRSSPHDAYMDIDDDGGMSDASDGDLGGSGGGGASSVPKDVPTGPSPAFVPPAETDPLPGSLPLDPANPTAQPQEKGQPRYPHIIESTVAFDPPRLPHSDAKNKKTRFARWQSHPKDMEKDLENYRKTVWDTRVLLQNAEKETGRYEAVGGHLRSHFLAHLAVLRNEGVVLERDLGDVQARCIERAELTKTRSTDTDGGIGAKAMHDVLAALKAKVGGSASLGDDDTPWCTVGVGGMPVSSTSSEEEKKEEEDNGDDDDNAEATSAFLASGWILPGDSIKTPMGDGVVVDVAAPKLVEIPDEEEIKAQKAAEEAKEKAEEEEAKKKKKKEEEEAKAKAEEAKEDAKAEEAKEDAKSDDGAAAKETPEKDATAPPAHGFGTSSETSAKEDGDAAAAPDKTDDKKSKDKDESGATDDATKKVEEKGKDEPAENEKNKPPAHQKKVELNLIPAQVRVRLHSDGSVQSFGLSDLTLVEDPSSYSDEQLIERWKKMVATAETVGCCANVDAMDGLTDGPPSSRSTSAASSVENSMEIDTPSQQVTSKEDAKARLDEYGMGYADLSKTKMSTNRVVPVASDMLLNPSLRGTSLATIPFEKFEQYLDPMLFDGKGVLGRHDNPGVPSDIKQWEDVRYELVTLKGRADQLRNELHRQRRIRGYNERTRHVLDERAERVEGLLAEMKSDLVTLKERLGDELGELGMTQDYAAELLTAYIKDRSSALENQEFTMPKKRSKPDVKAPPPPRVSRRNKSNQGSDDNDDTSSMKGDDDDSTTGKKKRNRSDESSESGATKPKRGGNRRQ